MKPLKIVTFLALLVFSTLPASAQTITPVQSTTTLQVGVNLTKALQPTQAGDLVVMYGMFGSNPTITDSQGNIWFQANSDDNEIQYTTVKAGPETITVTFPTAAYWKVVIVEFPGSWVLADILPQRCLAPCSPVFGGQSLSYNDETTTPSSFPLTTTSPGELVIGYGNYDSMWPPPGAPTAETGWAMAGFIPNRAMQYTIQSAAGPITSIFTQPFLPNGIYATEGIIAFKSTNTPPPPSLIDFTVTGSLLFDDKTPLAFGATVNVQQLNNQAAWINAGTITSDSSGNITGTFIVDPNQATSSGFVTFQFSVVGVNSAIQQTFPIQVFQQGSTGVNLSLVLFKSTMLPKSFSAGLLP